MLAIGFLVTALVAAVFVLAILTPKRDRSLRSKEKALRTVTPADVRAERECADLQHVGTVTTPAGNVESYWFAQWGPKVSPGSIPGSLAKDGSAGRSTRRGTPAGLMAEQDGRLGLDSEAGGRSQPSLSDVNHAVSTFLRASTSDVIPLDGVAPKGEVQTFGLAPRLAPEPDLVRLNPGGVVYAADGQVFVPRFAPMGHASTISYDSFPVAAPSESRASDDGGDVSSPQQLAEGEAPPLSGESGGED